MNHLAHAFLARESDHWIVGSLIADVRPRVTALPPEILEGIRLHQLIDGFAEKNPHHREMRAMLRPAAGLYAGVAADIFSDHFLATHWGRYTHQPLENFTAHVYKSLYAANGLLPKNLQMANENPTFNWLASYQTRAGLERALLRVRTRVKSTRRFPVVENVLDHFFSNSKALALPFSALFDELLEVLPDLKEKLY